MRARNQFAAILSRLSLCVLPMFLAGCGNMISRSINHGQLPVPPGCIGPSQPEQQYAIDFTVAYTLEFAKDVTPYRSKLSKEKVLEFVSIGEQEVAKDYLIPASNWTTAVNPCSEDAVVAEVSSPWSTKTSSSPTSAAATDLMHVDKDYKDPTRWSQIDYQWRFHGTVVGAVSQFDPRLINLVCRLRVEL
jgi:hypothetical protein